jgi:hypothetical protein
MRLIIEARLEHAQMGAAPAEAMTVEVVERQDGSVANLGLTLAEGRALLAKVQSILVSQQTAGWMASQVACHRCGSMLEPIDCHADRVWQGQGTEPEALGVWLRGEAGGRTPLCESALLGSSPANHSGIAVPAGQVGRPSALSTGD